MKIGRVLYPTDFSDTAREALTHALFLAEQYDAELHLLHAVVLHEYDPNEPSQHFPEAEELFRRLFEIADSEMSRLTSKPEASALRIREAKRKGFSAAEVILEYSHEIEADLIVMGTHGRRGAARMLLGSVAEEVLRRAECPVLTLRQRDQPRTIESIEKILVPVDFSEHSGLSLRSAGEFARRYGARLQILHVVEIPTYPYFYVPPETEILAERKETATKALAELVAEVIGETAEYEIFVSDGRAASEIIDFAEANGSDLVVIATHGLTGLERLLIGSTAEEVVRRAECPVLTVKSFGKVLV
jgi:nucleotide-binding universal stress UspA family protein